MRLLTIAAAALCLGINASAEPSKLPADPYSGYWLHSAFLAYRAQSSSADAMAYAAYVSGIVDMALLADHYGMKKRLLCPPLGMPMKEYLDIVGRYIEAHPGDFQNHRAYLVVSALRAELGCEEKAALAAKPAGG